MTVSVMINGGNEMVTGQHIVDVGVFTTNGRPSKRLGDG